jgi:hypothetical protein
MKNNVIRLLLISVFVPLHFFILAQNVGIGTLTPSSKLQIIGSADTTQLIIDANGTQSNTHPLIKLRNSIGQDLMWIHADTWINLFIGVNAGRVNSGIPNTFIGGNAGYSNTLGGENVAIGYQALFSNTMGFTNSALGNNALYSNITGSNNVAIGDGSLYSNVAGSNATAIGRYAMLNANDSATPFTNFNVAVGFEALKGGSLPSVNTGNYNTATGYTSLWSNTTGGDNTATGYRALYYNTTGEYNSGIGAYVLHGNTSGSFNTGAGRGALSTNVAGSNATAIGYGAMGLANNTSIAYTNYNVAVGYEALRGGSFLPENNTGNYNTALGYQSLAMTTTGEYNSATGYQALFENNVGELNTANGSSALKENTTGSFNTGIGANALSQNTVGSFNTGIGVGAMVSNVAGSNATAIGQGAMLYANNTATPFANYNVAVGYEALAGSVTAANNTGNFNTALGHTSLWKNTTGSSNTATGYNALQNNTTGTLHTACGESALLLVTGSTRNTAIGKSSGSGYVNGNWCTFIGAYADGNGVYANSSVLGDGAQFLGDNYIRIGDGSVGTIGGAVAWSVLSDGRFKTNVTEEVKGLEFISKLRPITYQMNVDAYNRHTYGEGYEQSEVKKKYDEMKKKGLMRNEITTFSGFIAQEVEEAAKIVEYDFSGVVLPQNNKDAYSLRYAEFVVPLVKAVQELNEELQAEVASLKAENELLIKRIEKVEALLVARD